MSPWATPEAAERAIFRGDFDHWGSVTVRVGPVVECGISKCHLDDVISALEDRT